MSEQILERPSAPIVAAEEPTGTGHRTFVVVALAIVAGLVLGGVVLFLFGPGGDDEVAAGAPAATGGGASATSGGDDQAATAGSTTKKATTKSKTRVSSRDPFAPLIAKPAPKPTPKAAQKEATTGSSGASSSDSLRPSSGSTLSVISISSLGDSLKLKLDGKKYEVEEGETFAKDYRLYDIFNADCAGFLHGDSNVVACKGSTVTVG